MIFLIKPKFKLGDFVLNITTGGIFKLSRTLLWKFNWSARNSDHLIKVDENEICSFIKNSHRPGAYLESGRYVQFNTEDDISKIKEIIKRTESIFVDKY